MCARHGSGWLSFLLVLSLWVSPSWSLSAESPPQAAPSLATILDEMSSSVKTLRQGQADLNLGLSEIKDASTGFKEDLQTQSEEVKSLKQVSADLILRLQSSELTSKRMEAELELWKWLGGGSLAVAVISLGIAAFK